jgi:hypothetical protein
MRLFARRVEHPLDVTVQRSDDADAREHRWAVMFCNQQKRPHRGLPFGTMFCLGPITSAVVQVFGRRDDGLTTDCGGRRPKSAKARSRGKLGTGGATGAMGI